MGKWVDQPKKTLQIVANANKYKRCNVTRLFLSFSPETSNIIQGILRQPWTMLKVRTIPRDANVCGRIPNKWEQRTMGE